MLDKIYLLLNFFYYKVAQLGNKWILNWLEVVSTNWRDSRRIHAGVCLREFSTWPFSPLSLNATCTFEYRSVLPAPWIVSWKQIKCPLLDVQIHCPFFWNIRLKIIIDPRIVLHGTWSGPDFSFKKNRDLGGARADWGERQKDL